MYDDSRPILIAETKLTVIELEREPAKKMGLFLD